MIPFARLHHINRNFAHMVSNGKEKRKVTLIYCNIVLSVGFVRGLHMSKGAGSFQRSCPFDLLFDSLRTQFHACAQFFFVSNVLPGNMHACALIEPRRASQVLRIDAQADLVCSPAVELSKGMVEQGQAQAMTTPGTAHTEVINPAYVELVLTKCASGKFVAVTS